MGTTVKANTNPNQYARSVGSRFSQLEDMEDLNGLDMEKEDNGAGKQAYVVGVEAKEQSSVEGREDTNNGASSGSSSIEKVVLSASHPDLIEGTKQVWSSKLEAAGNPTGQGILRRIQEKV